MRKYATYGGISKIYMVINSKKHYDFTVCIYVLRYTCNFIRLKVLNKIEINFF